MFGADLYCLILPSTFNIRKRELVGEADIFSADAESKYLKRFAYIAKDLAFFKFPL